MKLVKTIFFNFTQHTKYCIVGSGSGGLNLASHLLRSGVHPSEIRMIDPATHHYYQPGFTMVGADLEPVLPVMQKMQDVVPKNVLLTKDSIKLVKPKDNTIVCESGQQFTYGELILATGIRLQFQKIQGLKQALDDPNSKVATIYQHKYAQKTSKLGKNFTGGKAIFTQPVLPIKCAGAPQKILYLWTDQWQKKQIPLSVQFYKTNAVMFGVPKYSQTLTQVAANYGIKTTFKTPLVKVKDNEATFQNMETKQRFTTKFDFLHVVPPMGPHSYIAESGLADAAGYLDCDKYTLRHNKFSNIWGIGDCTSLPCSKTAAAIFSQTQVLHDNLIAVRKNPTLQKLPASYSGYASCPLFVGKRKLMLAQFKYDGVVDQTFFKDQQKPRTLFYLMKRLIFPFAYWICVPRGLWAGRKGIRWI